MGSKRKKSRRQQRRERQRVRQAQTTTAESLLEKGSFDEAARLLQRLVAQNPTNDELRRLLAEALVQLDKASEVVEVLLPIPQKTPWDIAGIVIGLFTTDQWDEAVHWSEQLVSQDPDNPMSLHMLAVAHSAGLPNGRLPQDARENIMALLHQAMGLPACPEEVILWLARLTAMWDGLTAEVDPEAEDIEAIVETLHLMAQDRAGWEVRREKGRQILEAALEQDPGRAEVRLALAEELLSIEDWSGAYSVLVPLLTHEVIKPEVAWCAYRILEAQGDREAALSYLDLIPYAGQGISTEKVKGDLLMAMGRVEEAITAYSCEIECEDHHAQFAGLAGRSQARMAVGDTAAAAADTISLAELWLAAANQGNSFSHFPLKVGEGSPAVYTNETGSVGSLCLQLQDGVLEQLELAPTQQGQVLLMCYHCSEQAPPALLLRAAALFQHPLLDYDLMWYYAQAHDLAQAVCCWLAVARSEYGEYGEVVSPPFYEDTGAEAGFDFAALSAAARQAIHRQAMASLDEVPAMDETAAVYLPFYQDFWRGVLFLHSDDSPPMFKEIVEAAATLEAMLPVDNPQDYLHMYLTWDRAYGLHGLKDLPGAARGYRAYLAVYPASGPALHNLSIVVEQQGDLAEALALSERAVAADPEKELYTTRLAALRARQEKNPTLSRPPATRPRPGRRHRRPAARTRREEIVPLGAESPTQPAAPEEPDEEEMAEDVLPPGPPGRGAPGDSTAAKPPTATPTKTKYRRKSLGKKVRFEVFKRDAFTCQYCGRSAPDVVLVIDHITPVAAGGSNDIMNLVTSCESCNAGKGARKLSDDAVVAKRKRQLDELQARREQLEMMLAWQRELASLEEDTAASLAQIWSDLVPGYGLNATGQAKLRKLVRRYGIPAVGEAMRIAAEQYLQYDAAGRPTQDSVELAWSKVGGICHVKEQDEEDPELKELFYIRGILKNRLSYVNPWMAMQLLRQARQVDISLDELRDLAREVTSWTQFRETLEDWTATNGDN